MSLLLMGAGAAGGADTTTGLVGSYLLKADSTDSVAGNNGVDTAVSYAGNNAVFTGSPSKIQLMAAPPISGAGGFTINMWINTAVANGNLFGCGQEAASKALFFFVNATGKICCDLYGVVGAASAANVNGGIDTMVGVTITPGGQIQMYVNGIASGAPVTKAMNIGSTYGMIGKTYSGSGFYTGTVRKLRIYSRALTAADMAALLSV